MFTIPGTLLAIAGLITFHEFGHFIVAKALGVYVRVFSLGFGGRMFGVHWRGTDYRVSWVPFGGYVRMAGGDPFAEGGAEPDDELPVPYEQQFMSKAPWKRLLIVLAGPMFNLLLPFGLFTALGVLGEPQPRAEVGSVEAGSVAERAGIEVGDRITAVDGAPMTSWYDVLDAFRATSAESVTLDLTRDGAPTRATLAFEAGDGEPVNVLVGDRSPYDLGLGNLSPDATVVVDDPASPAGRAGVQTGDVLTRVNSAPVRSFHDLESALLEIADVPGTRVDVEVMRAGEPVTLAMTASIWATAVQPADGTLWQRWGLASATVSIESIEAGSAAEQAGLAAGDRVLAVADTPVRAWYDVVRTVAEAGEGEGDAMVAKPLSVTYRRGGEVRTVTVTPNVVTDSDELGRYHTRARLGIGGGGAMIATADISRVYPLPQAFARSVDQTWRISSYIVDTLSKLVIGQRDFTKTLGGPVAIFQQMKQAAEHGVFDLFRQIGVLSLSLGIINLVPIPILDGGQIFMYVAEWLRGRPLPLRIRERAQQAGIIFVVLLMLAVTLKDIVKFGG